MYDVTHDLIMSDSIMGLWLPGVTCQLCRSVQYRSMCNFVSFKVQQHHAVVATTGSTRPSGSR